MSTNEIKQDEIIRMAREVGIEFDEFPHYSISEISKEQLNEFAAIVAAHEREKLKNVAILSKWYEELDKAVLAEREACAKSVYDSTDWAHEERDMILKEAIAAAIRTRGEK